MRQVKAKIYAGLSYLLFQVAGVRDHIRYQGYQFSLDLFWSKISEVNRQSFLDQFENGDVVFKNRIFQSFAGKLKEKFKADFWGNVVSVNLSIHSVTTIRVKVVNLLFHFLNSGLSRRPRLALEARNQIDTKQPNQWF